MDQRNGINTSPYITSTGPDRTSNTGPDRTYSTGPDRTYNTGPDRTFSTGPDRTLSTTDGVYVASTSINAIPEDYNEAMQPTKFAFLFFLDAVWSATVIFPLIVMYWSGTWYLLDSYMLPDRPQLSTGVSLAAGIVILVLMYYILPVLETRIEVKWSLKHVLVSRVIIYITAQGMVLIFRGVWNYTDYLVDKRIEISWAILIFSQTSLLILKSSSSAAGSPMVLQTDITEDFYTVLPRCRTQANRLFYYTLDVLLSVLVIFTLIILLWASLWQVCDSLILPNNQLLSLVVSLGAGYAFTIVLFTIQRPLERLLVRMSAPSGRRLDCWLAYSGDAVYGCVSTVVVLLLWRGLWGMVRTYLLIHPAQWKLGLAFHVLGFFGMIVLQVGKTLGSVGCAVDGEYLVTAHLRADAGVEETSGIDLYAMGISRRTGYFTLLYHRHLQSLRPPSISTDDVSEEEEEESEEEGGVSERRTLLRNDSSSRMNSA